MNLFLYGMSNKFKRFLSYNDITENEFISHCNGILKFMGIEKTEWEISFAHNYTTKSHGRLNGSALAFLKKNCYQFEVISGFITLPFNFSFGNKFTKESIIFMLAHEFVHFNQYHEGRLITFGKDYRSFCELAYNTSEMKIECMRDYMRVPWEFEANNIAYEYCKTVFDYDFTPFLSSLHPDMVDVVEILQEGPNVDNGVIPAKKLYEAVFNDRL